MRKIQILALALGATCAISALVSSTAFGAFELAQWLVGGVKVGAELAVDAEGELLFENVLNGGAIVCSGLFEGTIGPESADLTTMVYDLLSPQNLIEELTGTAIQCTKQNICEAPMEIWPINLPWVTEVELEAGSNPELYFELLFKGLGAAGESLPGYHIKCKVSFLTVEESCEAPEGTSVELVNKAGVGAEAVGSATPLATCNGEKEAGLITAIAGNKVTSPEGEVTVSE